MEGTEEPNVSVAYRRRQRRSPTTFPALLFIIFLQLLMLIRTGSGYPHTAFSYEKAYSPSNIGTGAGERTATFIFNPITPARFYRYRPLPSERQLKISLTVTFDRENYQKWCADYPSVCQHQRYQMAMSDLKFPLCPYGAEERKKIYDGEKRALDEWNSLFSPRPCDQIGHDIYELLDHSGGSSSTAFTGYTNQFMYGPPPAASMLAVRANVPAGGTSYQMPPGANAGGSTGAGGSSSHQISSMMSSAGYDNEWYQNFVQHYQNLWAKGEGQEWFGGKTAGGGAGAAGGYYNYSPPGWKNPAQQ